MNGIIDLYAIVGKSNEQDAMIEHTEKFGKSTLNLNVSYANNDYLQSPGTQLETLQAQFTSPQTNGSYDSAAFNLNHNSGLGETSSQGNGHVDGFEKSGTPGLKQPHARLFGRNSSVGGFDNSSYDSQLFNIQFEADQDLKRATAELQYLDNIPIGSGASTIYGILEDEAPVITVRSDSYKLLGQNLGNKYQFQTDFSAGTTARRPCLGRVWMDFWRTAFDFTYTKPDDAEKKFDYSGDRIFQRPRIATTPLNMYKALILTPDTIWVSIPPLISTTATWNSTASRRYPRM